MNSDLRRILGARAGRGFVDGAVSVLLPVHLGLLGYSASRVGLVVTATMLGSALLTLFVGFAGSRWSRRAILMSAAVLMAATGIGFASVTGLALIVAVAVVGTLNPSSGDISVFLPTEQALLPQLVEPADRTRRFAHYGLAGSMAGALGSLAAGVPERIADATGADLEYVIRLSFLVYALVALEALRTYRRLSPAVEPVRVATLRRRSELGDSRPIVLRMAALFSLDSFGSGFASQSMIALWLFGRFDLSVALTGTVFFWTSTCTALSMLLAPRIAARLGLVRTMAYTHLPANVFLIGAGLMPTAPLAVGCLVARSLFSTMDVPARTSWTMSVVPEHRRAATAAVTNVPRSLAAVPGPMLAGLLLDEHGIGWPLVVAGAIKVLYDLILLAQFGRADTEVASVTRA